MFTGSKTIDTVMLTDVFKSFLAYSYNVYWKHVHGFCCVSYQCHVSMQMFANIFCGPDGNMSPSLSGIPWMNVCL